MNCLLHVAAFVFGMTALPVRAADVVVAPPPREVRSDGSRDAVPDAPRAQDPRETVERIINNSRAVSEKLARTDTGADTQKTQNTILKDIKSLIQQEENPPSPKPDQGDSQDQPNKNDQPNKSPPDKTPPSQNQQSKNQQDKQPNNDQQQKDQQDKQPKKEETGDGGMPKKDGNDQRPSPQSDRQPDPKKNEPSGGEGQPMPQSGNQSSGNDQQTQGRRPRQNRQDQADPQQMEIKKPKPGAGEQAGNLPPPQENAKNGGQGKGTKSNQPQNAGAGARTGVPTSPSIPLEETTVKDVWGYLPDKLRQQAMQYYKQDFMPRYAKLLEHYYSSLSDKSIKK